MNSTRLVEDESSPTEINAEEKTCSLTDETGKETAVEKEKLWKIFIQSLFPFIIGGLSSIAAGQVLNFSQSTDAYIKIPELMGVTPSLQGLKGNVELIFAAKMSTLAHKGVLDDTTTMSVTVFASIGLQQVQLLIMSTFATFITIGRPLYRLMNNECYFSWKAIDFLFTVALLSITVSSLAISALLIGLIIIARKYNINPDNVTTPIAASCSDLLAILTILLFSWCLQKVILGNYFYIGCFILIGLFGVLPLWIILLRKKEETISASKSGWLTLIISCLLSSAAGQILVHAASSYRDISLFAPILLGITGNRTAMQTSRISTHLHTSSSLPGVLPKKSLWIYSNPIRAFISSDEDARAARLLLFTAAPFQVLFILIALSAAYLHGDGGDQIPITFQFFFGYLITSMFHMTILLYMSQMCVHAMWSYKIDPDFHAIPILSGLGDLLGTCLLTGIFKLLDLAQSKEGALVRGKPTNSLHIDPSITAICNMTLLTVTLNEIY